MADLSIPYGFPFICSHEESVYPPVSNRIPHPGTGTATLSQKGLHLLPGMDKRQAKMLLLSYLIVKFKNTG